jgi:hypothetical protein
MSASSATANTPAFTDAAEGRRAGDLRLGQAGGAGKPSRIATSLPSRSTAMAVILAPRRRVWLG